MLAAVGLIIIPTPKDGIAEFNKFADVSFS